MSYVFIYILFTFALYFSGVKSEGYLCKIYVKFQSLRYKYIVPPNNPQNVVGYPIIIVIICQEILPVIKNGTVITDIPINHVTTLNTKKHLICTNIFSLCNFLGY